MDEALNLIAEIEAESDSESDETEEETVEEEFLLDTDSDEAILEAAGIYELDLDSDELHEQQSYEQSNSLDLDSLLDNAEGDQE
jgi:hypothetical protein